MRLAVNLGFSKGFMPADQLYQVEFLDARTNYETSIGMVWIDAIDGTVLQVDTQTSNG